MNVGIVGGNSDVGTELAVVLRSLGHDVIPIVRNRIGTAFLDMQGFDCRVGDVTDDADAQTVLDGLDIVAVPAFVSYYTREGAQPRRARRLNEAIIEHTVRHAPADATVAYFSTIATFGNEIGVPDSLRMYTREKRHAEDVFEQACADTNTNGVVLRLGHVLGPNQSLTRAIESMAADSPVRIRAGSDREANVVHTATIADALVECYEAGRTGTYTLVNEPQWTWRDVFEWYAPADTRIRFLGADDSDSGGQSLLGAVVSYGWNVAMEFKEVLRPIHLYIPERINQQLLDRHKRTKAAGEISKLRAELESHTHEFDYKPVPGPLLEDLPRTADRLDDDLGLSVFES